MAPLRLCPDPEPGDFLRVICADDFEPPPSWLNASDAEPNAEIRRRAFHIVRAAPGAQPQNTGE